MSIFVGNLPFRAEQDDVAELFAPFGDVVSCSLPLERDTGRKRGFAFVEMVDDAAETKAIDALQGAELMGRPLRINKAEPRGAGGGGGGGQRRGGYGNGAAAAVAMEEVAAAAMAMAVELAAGALGAAAPVPAAGKTAAMALPPLPLATILMRAAPVAAAAVAGIPVAAIPAVAATTGAPKARQGRGLARSRLIAPLLQGQGRRFQHAGVRISAAGGPG